MYTHPVGVQPDLLCQLARARWMTQLAEQREQARPRGLGERVVTANGEGLVEHV